MCVSLFVMDLSQDGASCSLPAFVFAYVLRVVLFVLFVRFVCLIVLVVWVFVLVMVLVLFVSRLCL